MRFSIEGLWRDKMACRMFVTVSMCLVFVVLAFGEVESPLEKAEALMADAKFYEALFALKPLLTTDEKSADQEEALWLANALCKTWVSTVTISTKSGRKRSRRTTNLNLCILMGS